VDAGNSSRLGTDGKIFTPTVTPNVGTVTSVDGVAPVSGNVPLMAVKGSNAGTPTAALTLWAGTAAQYSAIATKSPTTIYVVTGTALLVAEALENAAHDVTGIATLESGEGIA
jgi:hypothetical protein